MEYSPSAPYSDTPLKLRARVAQGSGWVGLRLEGIIDEQSRLDDIVERMRSLSSPATLVIDMGGITRLNSVGVRDWVLALRALRGLFPRVQLMDCTPVVMNEVNFVRNFSEGTVIASFQAPLFCTRCSKESTSTIDVFDAHTGKQLERLPSFACDRNDCENALDDDESSFLAFLDGQTGPADAATVRRLVAETRGAFAGRTDGYLELGGTTPNASAVPNPRPISSAATPQQSYPSPTSTSKEPAGRKTDLVFYFAVAAMVVVLGVLVYLIATLE